MMRKAISNFFLFSILTIQLLGLLSCANIVPPTGGEVDKTPPVLLSQSPQDSILNKEVYKISLRFNKYMEVNNLQKELTTSPLLSNNPSVMSYGKRIEIKLPDSSLRANTTYRIHLGNALTDNREQTPYPNYIYTFSTGDYFDSLKLYGTVKDAQTGFVDTSTTIFLYPADTDDSAILKEKPEYVGKVKSNGTFLIESLPNRAFKIFAVSDKGNNFIYSPLQEKIDFWDTLVVPSVTPDSSMVFSVFRETDDSGSIQEESKAIDAKAEKLRQRQSRHSESSKSEQSYKVQADTSDKINGNFDIKEPLKIEIYKTLETIDSDKVVLTYDDDGMEVEATYTLETDSNMISIKTKWHEDKLYTLRLVKDWAKDTSGESLPPGKFPFKTRKVESYATLNLSIDSAYLGEEFLFVLLKDGQIIWSEHGSQKTFHIPLLNPGDYLLRLVLDENKNGQWDTGDLFAKKHAEKVIPFRGRVLLKAGWVNDVEFSKTENKKKNN